MAIIIPPEHSEELPKKLEKKKNKIIIYFKKEIDLEDSSDFVTFAKIIEKAYKLGLFDEILILNGREIEEFLLDKEEIVLSTLKEIKHLKEEYLKLVDVLKKVLNLIKERNL